MKVIVAGSRSILKSTIGYIWVKRAIDDAIADGWEIGEVVSGGAKGVDHWGELWAETNDVPVKRFPADWKQGKKAGPLRNGQMADYADALIAVWDGESRGTANMIEEMRKLDKPIKVVRFELPEEI